MFKKTITYKDWNGVERTEEFRFNMTRSELQILNDSMEGGLANRLQRIHDAKDNVAMTDFFVKIILDSYGIVSDDGRRFQKSEDISKSFYENPAFDTMFQWLINEPGALEEFFLEIFPSDVKEMILKAFDGTPSLASGN